WITLPAVSASLTDAQPYSIGPNTSSSPLSGSILIAGETIPVAQDGASSCTYGLSAASQAFGVNGGSFTVNVTTQPGCAWSTVSYLNWVTFPNGSSGSGSGSVTIQAAANTIGFESGTLTTAGQPFTVTQAASPCGGTEVSGQVTVSLLALLSPWTYGGYFTQYSHYSQQVRLMNTGPSIPGPISLVLRGICGIGNCPFVTQISPVVCNANDFVDDPAIVVAPNGLSSG